MHALETEMEAAHRVTANGQPRELDSNRPKTTAEAAVERQAEHFSPDPLKRTDRYRLVTPYRLSSMD